MSAVQNYFICNGITKQTKDFSEDLINGETTIYEVIKVIDSKPIFLIEHLQRLQNSLQKAGINYFAEDLVRTSIVELLSINPVKRNNIRVAIVFNHKPKPDVVAVYFIPSKYPSNEDYLNGVCIESISAERDNPTAKIENKQLRNRANQIMEKKGLFEVLLVNHENKITEGSRSNIFFVKNGTIITAPNDDVLGGITRDKVLSICRLNNFSIEMRCLDANELPNVDAIFITGTSPCVLPVKQCNGILYDVQHQMVETILKQYLEEESK